MTKKHSSIRKMKKAANKKAKHLSTMISAVLIDYIKTRHKSEHHEILRSIFDDDKQTISKFVRGKYIDYELIQICKIEDLMNVKLLVLDINNNDDAEVNSEYMMPETDYCLA